MDYKQFIHIAENFPKDGISFKDFTPLLANHEALMSAKKEIVKQLSGRTIDVVIGIESRGFILGPLVTADMGLGFVMARKKGKLPPPYITTGEYTLEYGNAALCIPTTVIKPGMRIHLHDDVLATGGTITSVIECLEKYGCIVDSLSFIIDLTFLHDKEKLKNFYYVSLMEY